MKRFRTWVFVFITVGLGVLSALVVLALKGSGLLTPKVRYWTVFNSAEGLSRGTSVFYKGVKIGWVDSVSLVPSKEPGTYEVKVVVSIKRRYMDIIGDGMVMLLRRPFVVGAASIEVVGRRLGSLPPGAFVPSQDTPQGKRILEKMGMAFSTERLIRDASELIAMLKDPSGPLFRSLSKLNQVEDEIVALTKRLRAIADQLNRSPLVGRQKELYDEIMKILVNLRQSAEKIHRVSKRLEKMPLLGGKDKSEKARHY